MRAVSLPSYLKNCVIPYVLTKYSQQLRFCFVCAWYSYHHVICQALFIAFNRYQDFIWCVTVNHKVLTDLHEISCVQDTNRDQKMGNSKSKKMKITQSDGQQTNDNRERINTIKTETNDVDLTKKNIEGDSNNEQIEEKSNDNASSASTVEVLDDK